MSGASQSAQTVVLTGGPHSGKTSLVERLRVAGHAVVPEAAFALIEQLNDELGLEEQQRWRQANLLKFQERVVALQDELERGLAPSDSGVVFLDRGRLDGLAYCEIRGVAPTARVLELAYARRYDHVELLDPVLPHNPRPESGRYGDQRVAEHSSNVLELIYTDDGYDVRRLPQWTLEERTDALVSWFASAR
jgi:predicted ATPase